MKGGVCGKGRWKEHITATRTNVHGVICCLEKKKSCRNNEQYYKNIANTVV